MSDGAAALVAAADRALAARDLAQAQALLRQAADAAPDDPAIQLRLAGVSRAAGQPRIALEAVHRALALAPLDFTALVMRATLLDRLEDPRAGEAWGHALAQRPAGDLPEQFATVIAQGEARHAAWLDEREDRLKAATAASEARSDDDERHRIARFRNNTLRRTRPYHSEPTHFFYPEIAEREFHPRRYFPWLAELEAATDVIAAEMQAVMAAERAELVPYIQYADHLPLDQWRPLNRNPDWTAIHLWQNGRRITANADHCPQTMALLERVPQPIITGACQNAMFSLLAPGTAIPPHVGVNNARLVCHLPLVVPDGCWFRVGAETRFWQRGEAFVFDDTIEHEALNPSDQLRIVFIFDVWHPDLSAVERDAVAALIAADLPGGAAGL
ncbi:MULTISPECIES: aspartyl/asparaginyl beta-hydroxylase domain-containing protein [unclassified Sphingomonas]|uniref:aspartyl/asparaginyl beta-hydroxylase domain-containing protein n=1 Tax=unclassified Sphingomonas TaxID=196159 RepID=UPI000BCD1391|nr:MAG: aspartyl beta-hydroxylase [Sphingomonas sp. 32-62-10]